MGWLPLQQQLHRCNGQEEQGSKEEEEDVKKERSMQKKRKVQKREECAGQVDGEQWGWRPISFAMLMRYWHSHG